MKLFKSATIVLCLAGFAVANAATIDLGTADYSSVDGKNFQSVWNTTAPVSKTITNLSEFTNVDTGNNNISHLDIDFFAGANRTIDFRFGLDGGFGVDIYFGNTQVVDRSDDIWWNTKWSNGDVLYTGSQSLLAGTNYSVDVYWAENSNSGNQSAQFTLDGGQTWQALSNQNLSAVSAVPEASTYAMMLGGLAMIGGVVARRKKQQ